MTLLLADLAIVATSIALAPRPADTRTPAAPTPVELGPPGPAAEADRWSSAMTYRFVGALSIFMDRDTVDAPASRPRPTR